MTDTCSQFYFDPYDIVRESAIYTLPPPDTLLQEQEVKFIIGNGSCNQWF